MSGVPQLLFVYRTKLENRVQHAFAPVLDEFSGVRRLARDVTALAEGVAQMPELERWKRLVVAAGFLIVAVALVLVVEKRYHPAGAGAQEKAKAVPRTLPPAVGSDDMATANRALARRQLAVIDETWPLVHDFRIEADGGTVGVWGRRRLDALRRAGAGKAEIIAALEKYGKDLDQLLLIAKNRENSDRRYYQNEIKFLRIEAEIWLNEEKAR